MSEADGVEGGVFVHRARVYWDELDALQMLHNARLVVHLERARIAWYESLDQPWALDARDNPDQVHVVRELRLEYLAPVRGTRTMRVEVWVERMGTTSCVYGFRFVDPDGDVLARGTQAIVKLDRERTSGPVDRRLPRRPTVAFADRPPRDSFALEPADPGGRYEPHDPDRDHRLAPRRARRARPGAARLDRRRDG